MNLPSLCIRRPVFTIVISLVLMVVGFIYYQSLPIRQLPNITSSKVTIVTALAGASPQLIEKAITTPIENALSSLSGVVQMRSNSQLGISYVTLGFELDTPINPQMASIRNKVAALKAQFPTGTKAPVVQMKDNDDTALMIIAATKPGATPAALSDYISRFIQPQIEQLPGVAEVKLYGRESFAVKLWLEPEKMLAHHVTIADIKRALSQQAVIIPSGQIESRYRNFTVITSAKLKQASQFNQLIVKATSGQVVRLNQVARVEVSSANTTSQFRINGKTAIGLAIFPEASANPVRVAKKVTAKVNALQSHLPTNLQLTISFDSATYIEHSLQHVYRSLFEALILVALVIFLFLGNLRAALIPIITVPICLLATFWPMHLLGFSINTITLLALVLAIGLVVDDAIVILENSYHHQQADLTPLYAAHIGAKEMVFAVIAMTLTLSSVYAPLAFIKGFSGKLYIQFGLTLASAVIFSGIIALTLSPMMCSRLLTPSTHRYSALLDSSFQKICAHYKRSLQWILAHRGLLMVVVSLTVSFGAYRYQQLPTELAPTEDQGFIIGLLNPPTNASLNYTAKYAKQLESIYQHVPEMMSYLTYTAANTVFSVLKLRPWEQRAETQSKITQRLNQQFASLIGVTGFAVNPAPLNRGSGNRSGLTLRILSSEPYTQFNSVLNHVVKQLKTLPGLSHVEQHLALDSSQLAITIDKLKAADQQVALSDIADTISTMIGGANPINFDYQGESYPVLLQLDKNKRRDLSTLNELYVQTASGNNLPLSQFVSISHHIGLDKIAHFDKLRTADITAELAPSYSMGQIVKQLQTLLPKTLPVGTQYRFAGGAKDYLAAQHSSLMAFALAMLFIYLVLSAQFESFLLPIVILLTVPLSIVGAILGLHWTGNSLNIYSQIGMVTLIGLVSKHGILITELANQRIQQGENIKAAIIAAATRRLRPILMTTLAMVLGALPLALATGAGAEARQQLGWVIVFGMSVGSVFSLYIIPAALLTLKRPSVADLSFSPDI